jgi:hypothetical protein
MHFHGGGYTDIKLIPGSWVEAFETLNNSDKWIVGFKEWSGGIAYGPAVDYVDKLIGCSAMICKPGTPLTEMWYNDMLLVLDEKLEAVKMYPAQYPQDCAEDSNGKYPIEWNEILGRIFHRVCLPYLDKISNCLPELITAFYR